MQGRRLAEMETQRNALAAEVASQHRRTQVALTHLRSLLELIHLIQATRAYRLLRFLGRWKWVKTSSSMIEEAEEMSLGLHQTTKEE
jgi:hypothetical protein